MQKISRADVGVPRAADPAKNPISSNVVCVALADQLVANPEDQYSGEKKSEIETHKPGEGNRDHGLGAKEVLSETPKDSLRLFLYQSQLAHPR